MTVELRAMFKQVKNSNLSQCSVSRRPAVLHKQDGVTVYLATAPEHKNLIGRHILVDKMPTVNAIEWDRELLNACMDADSGDRVIVHIGQW